MEGFETLAELPRAVSVFGSARSKPDSPECALAEQLGAALAGAGIRRWHLDVPRYTPAGLRRRYGPPAPSVPEPAPPRADAGRAAVGAGRAA